MSSDMSDSLRWVITFASYVFVCIVFSVIKAIAIHDTIVLAPPFLVATIALTIFIFRDCNVAWPVLVGSCLLWAVVLLLFLGTPITSSVGEPTGQRGLAYMLSNAKDFIIMAIGCAAGVRMVVVSDAKR